MVKFFLFLLLALCAGCTKRSDDAGHEKIILAGSTSIQPIAEKLAEHYMKLHPEVKIEVQGGGSSAGIQAAKNQAADIGTSSRELKANEKDLLEHIIAYDAIVFIVHPGNPIENLTMRQIRQIFAGEIRDWSQVDPKYKGAITVITREEGSGTRGAFEEIIMQKNEISPRCLVQDSMGALREIVSSDPNALGYVSFGALHKTIRPLALDGIPPTLANMTTSDKSKRYKVIRPFLFLTSQKPHAKILNFLQFIYSHEGTTLLHQEGLIPNLEKSEGRPK